MALSSNSNTAELTLFYFENFDDRWVPFDRYPRYVARWLLRRNRLSGYRQLAKMLCNGLQRAGIACYFNAYRRASKSTDLTIGILGKNILLDQWHPENPAVFGPCMLDHPKDRIDLLEKYKTKFYLVPSRWVHDMFLPYFGDKVVIWPIGIDLENWPDFSKEEKSLDFLIYEKFLWDRPAKFRSMLAPILDELHTRGFSTQVLHCGSYSHKEYRAHLSAARRMIFLCEHETQGQAYQQALACNVPVFAWNQGYWLDPKASLYERHPVPASSVPYFSDACGMEFRTLEEFKRLLPAFWETEYFPRTYVREHLDLIQSARRYFEIMQIGNNPA